MELASPHLKSLSEVCVSCSCAAGLALLSEYGNVNTSDEADPTKALHNGGRKAEEALNLQARATHYIHYYLRRRRPHREVTGSRGITEIG